ncbi:hypothetical protein IQ279_03670 [Streptomyces verrucosisporus]|uniref:hypothetical protein n=1 Tax=Streptomyces verrucosisporus TaxID=1695161 RepID=UPI0019D1907D|nr:hypothetical protein [Streptomyces verrucosisporus]MBN3928749.1 hypothetical protein [Streptomyces verrucosisporus]
MKRTLTAFLKPSGMRAFVLGISLAVGGLAGGVRTLAEDAEVLKGVAALGVGAIGTLIALVCVLERSRR